MRDLQTIARAVFVVSLFGAMWLGACLRPRL